jgi:hypothetical protein
VPYIPFSLSLPQIKLGKTGEYFKKRGKFRQPGSKAARKQVADRKPENHAAR